MCNSFIIFSLFLYDSYMPIIQRKNDIYYSYFLNILEVYSYKNFADSKIKMNIEFIKLRRSI